MKSATVALLLVWAGGFDALLLVASWADPVGRAIVLMAIGLLLIWVVLIGGITWRYQDTLVRTASRLGLDWRSRFVLLATSLALIEEAIATLMTNAGPLLGDSTGQAAITASSNYLEVVTRHSVVVFIPMFIAWAVLLSWRAFPPFAVMILFGITGLFGEMLAFGQHNLVAAGFWVLVYGLMVYLPACTVPTGVAPPARPWHYPLAVVAPIVFAVPVVWLLLWVWPA